MEGKGADNSNREEKEGNEISMRPTTVPKEDHDNDPDARHVGNDIVLHALIAGPKVT